MKNTLKDVVCVSAIVEFLTSLPKHEQSPGISSSNSSFSQHTKPLLTRRVQDYLKRMSAIYTLQYRSKLRKVSVYEDFDVLMVDFENHLTAREFSTIDFLKHCCRACSLAHRALHLGLRPAAKLAECYILRAVQRFRSKQQFGNDNWRYMDSVVSECSREGVLEK